MGSFIGVQKIAAKRIGVPYEEYISRILSEKWCTSCSTWRNKAEFNIDRHRGDGLTARCHTCTRVKVKKSWKGRESTFKGRKHSDGARKKNSEKQKERLQKGLSTPPMLGKSHSVETRIKISQILRIRGARGKKCHSYKDGKLAERMGLRFSIDYKRWRFDVFSRDKFTCQKCGDNRGGNLNAHHIKPFADFPELRLAIENGITLCEPCHKKEHQKLI